MSIFDRLAGNAGKINNDSIKDEVGPFILDNETVLHSFKLVRDLIIFTDKRLILIDVQGTTGRKRSYEIVPYGSISRFSIETAGTFDSDSELNIFISSATQPTYSLELGRNADNVYAIARTLSSAIL